MVADQPKPELSAMFDRHYQTLLGHACGLLSHERPNHTLEPSALVHEVFVRLQASDLSWRSATHFASLAAHAMHNVLVDHARGVARGKRGGGVAKVTLSEALAEPARCDTHLLVLHEALERLTCVDARAGAVMEQRVFAGMTLGEIADALQISYDQAKGDWRFARAWLMRELFDER